MKVSLRLFRLSRKMLIVAGGVLFLCSAAGATALYIGKDRLLGGKIVTDNGLDCTTVKVLNIHKKDRYWIRKYIKVAPADGLTRVRTALRVAAAVFVKDKPDLVQVVVLDANGPADRADMTGHAVGADVIYVPYPEKLAEVAETQVLSAKYMDGAPSSSGEFFGEKIHVPENDAKHLITALTTRTDCVEPAPPENASKAEGEGGKKAEGEGKGEGKKKEGEAAKPAEGEAPMAEGEAAKPAEGEKTGAVAPATATTAEKPGWFASLKAKIFGSKAPEPPAGAKATDKPQAEGEAAREAGKPEGEAPAAASEAAKPEGEAAEAESKPVEVAPESVPLPGIDTVAEKPKAAPAA
nr:hypothetical protein [uncultured Gellertiella sp.]